MQRNLLILAGLFGFLGVLAGTFGAHGLKGRLEPALLESFEVGVRYHLVHAVALLGVALLARQSTRGCVKVAGGAFVLGILLFSGSLYILALSGQKWLGMIAPIGGTAYMVGWIALMVAGFREGKCESQGTCGS